MSASKDYLHFYPNLGEGLGEGGRGGVILTPLCWVSLNNSELIKAVTLAFCSIQ